MLVRRGDFCLVSVVEFCKIGKTRGKTDKCTVFIIFYELRCIYATMRKTFGTFTQLSQLLTMADEQI